MIFEPITRAVYDEHSPDERVKLYLLHTCAYVATQPKLSDEAMSRLLGTLGAISLGKVPAYPALAAVWNRTEQAFASDYPKLREAMLDIDSTLYNTFVETFRAEIDSFTVTPTTENA